MTSGTESFKVVVAGPTPLVVSHLCGFLDFWPKALEQIFLPAAEIDEWIATAHGPGPLVENELSRNWECLLEGWRSSGFLITRSLTRNQEDRAQKFRNSHPETPPLAARALVMARTLTDTEMADALLADECWLRNIARELEGIQVIGSIGVLLRLGMEHHLSCAELVACLQLGQSRGLVFRDELIDQVRAFFTR